MSQEDQIEVNVLWFRKLDIFIGLQLQKGKGKSITKTYYLLEQK